MFDYFPKPSYYTKLGQTHCSEALTLLKNIPDDSINLVITSPPFALQRQKEYGNEAQSEYVGWLTQFATEVYRILKEDGSFVLDLGGAYKKRRPVRSLYNYRILIRFCDDIGFNLAEEFFWYNPSKLPSPIEWVNKKKIRAKDSVNTVWWFSKSDYPKADVRNVLTPYSERMKKLIKDQEKFYQPKKRPSGHDISKNFGKDNNGAIPSNLLHIPNSDSNSQYLKLCKQMGIKGHPARYPEKLPEFFINFLTEPKDIVLDFFAGSNTTGIVCEKLNRRWISIDNESQYIASSAFRFLEDQDIQRYKEIYTKIFNNPHIGLKMKRTNTLFDIADKAESEKAST